VRTVFARAGGPGGPARDIYVEDGRIAGIEPAGDIPGGWEVVDCAGLWALPGLVDVWAHLPSRAEAWREDADTLTAAALAGGYTTVCAVTREHRAEGLSRREATVRLLPIALGTHQGHLAELDALRRAGAVAYQAEADAGLMRRLLEYAELPVAVHAEDPSLARGGVAHESALSGLLGLPGIPAEAETVAVARDLLLLRAYGGRLHFAHLSTAAAVEMVRRAKRAGLPVTAAVPIYNLVLNEEAIRDYDTAARLVPPLRGEADRKALVAGVLDGTVDAIVSNHRACPAEEKEVPFAEAAPGAVSLELVLSAALSVLPADAALRALSGRCFGLEPQGMILFDPEAEWIVDPATFRSRGRHTPLAGRRLRGRVVRVLHKHTADSIITTTGGA
jgi:dihydroorotase